MSNEDENDVVVVPEQPKRSSKREDFILREEGRSLLPVSRVQRIIKADKVCRSRTALNPLIAPRSFLL